MASLHHRPPSRWPTIIVTALVTAVLTSLVWLMLAPRIETPAPPPEPAAPPPAPPAAVPAAPAAPPVAPLPPGATLRAPVEGGQMVDGFGDARDGGSRPHTGVDIMAPAGTPVRAVADGSIAKLFLSERGGNTVYQFDPDKRVAYYYAHLQGYAPNLREGQPVKAGDVLGTVGSTGSASGGSPHLHFEMMELQKPGQWYDGMAVNPWPYLTGQPGRGPRTLPPVTEAAPAIPANAEPAGKAA